MQKVIKSLTKSKKAFTLIELLIVIAIIGILAAVIFVNLNAARNKANDAQVKSDLVSLSQALEIVKVDRNLKAPAANPATIVADSTIITDDNINNWLDSNGKPMIASVPKNPVGGTGINSYYINISTTDSTSYAIYSKLTSGQFYCIQNGTSSTVTAATDCIPL